MKILFMLFTAIATLFSGAPTSSKFKVSEVFSVKAEIDESDLQQDKYSPKTSEMSRYLEINKVQTSNGQFGIQLKIDHPKILNLIKETAYSSGLFTGETKFELLDKFNNLVIDYSEWLWNTDIMIVNKNGTKTSSSLRSALQGQAQLSSLNQSVVITPTAKASSFRLNFSNMKLDSIALFDKRTMKIIGTQIYDGNYDRPGLIDYMVKEGESTTSEDFTNLYIGFSSKLHKEWHSKIPYSNSWDIIKASQNSEKYKLKTGYNVKMTNGAVDRKLPGNPYVLLIPLGLFATPLLYFLLKRILRK